MKTKEIMTPVHPLWNDFFDRLEGPEGCNFRKNEEGKIVWDCPGDENIPLAKAILKSYDSIDINASLVYFKNHGGYCDCEILFNVAP